MGLGSTLCVFFVGVGVGMFLYEVFVSCGENK